MNSQSTTKAELLQVQFVKEVSVGSINPNSLLTDEARAGQVALLNRCLGDYPKGTIIGKDIVIGRYQLGEHELTMQRTVYHIGFSRKPTWLEK